MNFIDDFQEKLEELNVSWDIYGIIDQEDNVFSIGDDTKLLGRVFEILTAPVIESVASDNDLEVEPAERQTFYPDFTLMESEDDENKTAVDIKTTYKRGVYKSGSSKYSYEKGDPKPLKFTLGSFGSYLRDNTKNIRYPYDTYGDHYVVGFAYTRNESASEGVEKSIEDRDDIKSPYEDVEYFVQEKYKVAGIKPGSGNTENIGSFVTNDVEDLQKGKGPFSELGEEVFEDYWRNYGEYRGETTYTDLDGYFQWKAEQEDKSVEAIQKSLFG